jgi:hypothetical protein
MQLRYFLFFLKKIHIYSSERVCEILRIFYFRGLQTPSCPFFGAIQQLDSPPVTIIVIKKRVMSTLSEILQPIENLTQTLIDRLAEGRRETEGEFPVCDHGKGRGFKKAHRLVVEASDADGEVLSSVDMTQPNNGAASFGMEFVPAADYNASDFSNMDVPHVGFLRAWLEKRQADPAGFPYNETDRMGNEQENRLHVCRSSAKQSNPVTGLMSYSWYVAENRYLDKKCSDWQAERAHPLSVKKKEQLLRAIDGGEIEDFICAGSDGLPKVVRQTAALMEAVKKMRGLTGDKAVDPAVIREVQNIAISCNENVGTMIPLGGKHDDPRVVSIFEDAIDLNPPTYCRQSEGAYMVFADMPTRTVINNARDKLAKVIDATSDPELKEKLEALEDALDDSIRSTNVTYYLQTYGLLIFVLLPLGAAIKKKLGAKQEKAEQEKLFGSEKENSELRDIQVKIARKTLEQMSGDVKENVLERRFDNVTAEIEAGKYNDLVIDPWVRDIINDMMDALMKDKNANVILKIPPGSGKSIVFYILAREAYRSRQYYDSDGATPMPEILLPRELAYANYHAGTPQRLLAGASHVNEAEGVIAKLIKDVEAELKETDRASILLLDEYHRIYTTGQMRADQAGPLMDALKPLLAMRNLLRLVGATTPADNEFPLLKRDGAFFTRHELIERDERAREAVKEMLWRWAERHNSDANNGITISREATDKAVDLNYRYPRLVMNGKPVFTRYSFDLIAGTMKMMERENRGRETPVAAMSEAEVERKFGVVLEQGTAELVDNRSGQYQVAFEAPAGVAVDDYRRQVRQDTIHVLQRYAGFEAEWEGLSQSARAELVEIIVGEWYELSDSERARTRATASESGLETTYVGTRYIELWAESQKQEYGDRLSEALEVLAAGRFRSLEAEAVEGARAHARGPAQAPRPGQTSPEGPRRGVTAVDMVGDGEGSEARSAIEIDIARELDRVDAEKRASTLDLTSRHFAQAVRAQLPGLVTSDAEQAQLAERAKAEWQQLPEVQRNIFIKRAQESGGEVGPADRFIPGNFVEVIAARLWPERLQSSPDGTPAAVLRPAAKGAVGDATADLAAELERAEGPEVRQTAAQGSPRPPAWTALADRHFNAQEFMDLAGDAEPALKRHFQARPLPAGLSNVGELVTQWGAGSERAEKVYTELIRNGMPMEHIHGAFLAEFTVDKLTTDRDLPATVRADQSKLEQLKRTLADRVAERVENVEMREKAPADRQKRREERKTAYDKWISKVVKGR